RAVTCVGRLPAPESLHCDAALGALLEGHAERIRDTTLRLQESIGAEVARDFADLLGKDRGVLDPMAVAVDHGVVEILPDLFRRMVGAHLFLPEGRDGITNAASQRMLPRHPKSNRLVQADGVSGGAYQHDAMLCV